jgi:hypothetical protein
MLSYTEQLQSDDVHARNPEPGDYWSDHLVGVCVVLAVKRNEVTLCKTKKDIGRDYWTWDLQQQSTMSKEEFREWLSYGPTSNGYWATCQPGYMLWASDKVKELTLWERIKRRMWRVVAWFRR